MHRFLIILIVSYGLCFCSVPEQTEVDGSPVPYLSVLEDSASPFAEGDWDGVLAVQRFLGDLNRQGWSLEDRKLLLSLQGQTWRLLVYDLKDLLQANGYELNRAKLVSPRYEGGVNFGLEYKKAYEAALSMDFMSGPGSFADKIFSIRSEFTGNTLVTDQMALQNSGETLYMFMSHGEFADLRESYKKKGESKGFEEQVKRWWKDTPYLDKSFYEFYDSDSKLNWEKTWAFFSDENFSVVADSSRSFADTDNTKYLASMSISFDSAINKFIIYPSDSLRNHNQKKIKNLLNRLHTDFVNNMNGINLASYASPAERIKDQVEEIVSFSRKLIYSHPFTDGNGRVFTNILVRHLLAENHLPQSLFNPQWIGNSFLTTKQLAQHVIEGMFLFNSNSLRRHGGVKRLEDLLFDIKLKMNRCN